VLGFRAGIHVGVQGWGASRGACWGSGAEVRVGVQGFLSGFRGGIQGQGCVLGCRQGFLSGFTDRDASRGACWGSGAGVRVGVRFGVQAGVRAPSAGRDSPLVVWCSGSGWGGDRDGDRDRDRDKDVSPRGLSSGSDPQRRVRLQRGGRGAPRPGWMEL